MSASILELGNEGYVSAEEVLVLRRTIFSDGIVNSEELDRLFDLAHRAPDGDREWHDYFVEAARDFYLREEEPHGYLTQDEFVAIKRQIARDGGTMARPIELELLIGLLEHAKQTPLEMLTYIMDQFRHQISTKADNPHIDEAMAARLKRFVFACGSDGNIAITKPEADFLFDLADATAAGDNHASWYDLFKKAIANHLMAYNNVEPMGRAEALDMVASLTGQTQKPHPRGARDFFTRLRVGMSDPSRKTEERFAALNSERERESVEAAKLTELETKWIRERIGQDGKFSRAEQELLMHLRSFDDELPPALQELLANAA